MELKSEIRFLTTPFKVILRHILCSLVWVADVRGGGGGGGGGWKTKTMAAESRFAS